MALEVASHNIKDGLSDMYRAPLIVAAVDRERYDAIVYPEAYAENDTRWLDNVQEDLDKKGYAVFHTLYDDEDDRKDRHGLLMAVRKEVINPDKPMQRVRLGGRWAISATLHDPTSEQELLMFGMHCDDRSSVNRRRTQNDLKTHLSFDEAGLVDGHVAVAADFNSSFGRDSYALKLGRVRFLRPMMEPFYVDPDPTVRISRLRRAISLGYRVIDMATDGIMEDYAAMGLRPVDPTHTPTIPAEDPKLRLDNILVSPRVDVVSYDVGDYNAAADHGIFTPVSDHRVNSAVLLLPRAA